MKTCSKNKIFILIIFSIIFDSKILLSIEVPEINIIEPKHNTSTILISGESEPNTHIIVTLNNGTPLMATISNEYGEWFGIIILPPGEYTIVAIAIDEEIFTNSSNEISLNVSFE